MRSGWPAAIMTVAVVATAQTAARVHRLHRPRITHQAIGVYVPAINAKIPTPSRRAKASDAVGGQSDAMIEGTGQIAEDQAKAVDEEAELLSTVAGASPPEEQRARQRQDQAGAVAPGTEGLAKLKELHVASSVVSWAMQTARRHDLPGVR